MTIKNPDYIYIESAEGLKALYNDAIQGNWIGFDTEFVGEKSYLPVLCLIQVVTPNNVYIIDPLKIADFSLFLNLISNRDILKITHAGENDYRLIYQLFDVLPQNVFDTQIAAGFVGYNYPVSFAGLLQSELKVRLDKGSATSDWESRPISDKQMQYALNDVIYLEQLWQSLVRKLEDKNRSTWVCEEFKKLETQKMYVPVANKEFYNNSLLPKLNVKEKLFLMRLYEWRIAKAERTNTPKERILQRKYIGHIASAIKGGRKALTQNRLIPPHIINKNVDTFVDLYEKEQTPEEAKVLESVRRPKNIHPKVDAVMDIVYLGIKIICADKNIAPELVIDRSRYKEMKKDVKYMDPTLTSGWRPQLLGDNVIHSIQNRANLEVDTSGEFFGLKLKA